MGRKKATRPPTIRQQPPPSYCKDAVADGQPPAQLITSKQTRTPLLRSDTTKQFIHQIGSCASLLRHIILPSIIPASQLRAVLTYLTKATGLEIVTIESDIRHTIKAKRLAKELGAFIRTLAMNRKPNQRSLSEMVQWRPYEHAPEKHVAHATAY